MGGEMCTDLTRITGTHTHTHTNIHTHACKHAHTHAYTVLAYAREARICLQNKTTQLGKFAVAR